MTLKATLEAALIGKATKADVIAACDEELNLPTPPGVRRGERYKMTETCTTCGHWRGLHRWDTMQCPANEHEDGQFRQTTYTEENDELAALRAERDELRALLQNYLSGHYTDAAAGLTLAFDEAARAVLAKYAGKEE